MASTAPLARDLQADIFGHTLQRVVFLTTLRILLEQDVVQGSEQWAASGRMAHGGSQRRARGGYSWATELWLLRSLLHVKTALAKRTLQQALDPGRPPRQCQLRISGFLDTKFDTVDIEFGTAVNELHRPPCRELHEAHRLLEETGDTFAAGDTILMGS